VAFEPALLSAVAEQRAEIDKLRKQLAAAEAGVGPDKEKQRLHSWNAELREEIDGLKRALAAARNEKIDRLAAENAGLKRERDSLIVRLRATLQQLHRD
jgi:hypothetical protein